jgi:hypothetical protein
MEADNQALIPSGGIEFELNQMDDGFPASAARTPETT